MNTRTLRTLGLATLALVALAAVVVVTRRGPTTAAEETGSPRFFPELEARINDVASVQVANAEGAFEVARNEEGWGMPSKGNFPVDFAKVKEVVVAISQLEKIEAKTKNPAYFSKLGLEDVGEPESTSTKIVLKDAAGEVLAALVVGDTHPRRTGAGKPSLYVREADSDQAWQVEGRVWAEPTAGNWLEKTICEIGRERIARVVTKHPDGEVLTIEKAAPEDTDWAVLDVPEGRELTWAGVGSSIAGAVARLLLQDVKPESEVDFSEAPNTVTEFFTWDGLVLTVRVMDTDEQSYLKLGASFDPSLRAGDEMGPEPAPAEGEDVDEGEGADDDEPLGKTVEEVTAEVETLNAHFAGWVYVVPGYQASNFKKRMDELLKKLPEPGDEAAPGLGPVPGDAPMSLEELFPDGLPPELEGVEFGEQTDTPQLGDLLGTDPGEPLEEPVLEEAETTDPPKEVVEEVEDEVEESSDETTGDPPPGDGADGR